MIKTRLQVACNIHADKYSRKKTIVPVIPFKDLKKIFKKVRLTFSENVQAVRPR
jgi:hypothetical protein